MGSTSAPILERMLRRFYLELRSPITLMGISPISPMVVEASFKAAIEVNAPLLFIASLNQVDVDGGYTGWTPYTFMDYVRGLASRYRARLPVIVGLDHGGPWLKDEHVFRNYSYEEALDATIRSIEAAVRAGYDVIHIDTTVDPHLERLEADVVARRTLELLEYSEEVRRIVGREWLSYEVGSDRWMYRDTDHARDLLSRIMSGVKRKGLERARILFMVGDVGTKVAPGNRLDVDKARELVAIASSHGLFLKVHSSDYVENPEDYPRVGVGGANIGPMFADIKYRVVKRLSAVEKEYLERGVVREASDLLDLIHEKVLIDRRWRKHADREEALLREEYLVGLLSRYYWCEKDVSARLEKLLSNLENAGYSARAMLMNELKETIKRYMLSFNLRDTASAIQNSPDDLEA